MRFFIQYCYVMLLWSNSIWKQYNTEDYTLTLSNIKTKIFSWVGEENEDKNVLNIFLCERRVVRPLARMATVNVSNSNNNIIFVGEFNFNWNASSNNKFLFKQTLSLYGLRQRSVGITYSSHFRMNLFFDHNYVSEELATELSLIIMLLIPLFLPLMPSGILRKWFKLDPTETLTPWHSIYRDVAMLSLLQLVQSKTKSLYEKVLQFEVNISNLLDVHPLFKSISVRGSKNPWLNKNLLCLISIKIKYSKKIFQSELSATVNQKQR